MPQRPDFVNTHWIGIDPGESGGIAVIGSSGGVWLFNTPATRIDYLDLLRRWAIPDIRAFAMVERVGGFVAGNPTPGSAMFKFGMSYERPLMALAALGITTEEVIPRTWQKEFGVFRRPNEKRSAFKARLKGRAQALFPKVPITLKTCDALLLAEYCRRKHGDTLGR